MSFAVRKSNLADNYALKAHMQLFVEHVHVHVHLHTKVKERVCDGCGGNGEAARTQCSLNVSIHVLKQIHMHNMAGASVKLFLHSVSLYHNKNSVAFTIESQNICKTHTHTTHTPIRIKSNI